jgi:hypothetical protein
MGNISKSVNLERQWNYIYLSTFIAENIIYRFIPKLENHESLGIDPERFQRCLFEEMTQKGFAYFNRRQIKLCVLSALKVLIVSDVSGKVIYELPPSPLVLIKNPIDEKRGVEIEIDELLGEYAMIPRPFVRVFKHNVNPSIKLIRKPYDGLASFNSEIYSQTQKTSFSKTIVFESMLRSRHDILAILNVSNNKNNLVSIGFDSIDKMYEAVFVEEHVCLAQEQKILQLIEQKEKDDLSF